jgi:polyhydroxybutyrate depolymerase
MRVLFIALAICLICTSAPALAEPDMITPPKLTGIERQTIKIGSLKRRFVMRLPTSPCYVHKTPAPLKLPVVIVLHGALGNAWTAEFDSGMTERANKEGFIVVYPYGTGVGAKQVLFWNAGACCSLASSRRVDDVSFIRELIALLTRNYNADPSRIYVAGASNGGMMAYRLATELSHQIAAIGSVEGCMFPLAAKPTGPVSIIEFHGTADRVIPYQGGTGSLMGYKVRNIAPVAKTVNYWVAQDHCQPLAQREVRDGYVKETFIGGDGGSAVCLVSISDGGHAWPGGRCAGLFGDKPSRKLSATDQMLDFFRQHPRHDIDIAGGNLCLH